MNKYIRQNHRYHQVQADDEEMMIYFFLKFYAIAPNAKVLPIGWFHGKAMTQSADFFQDLKFNDFKMKKMSKIYFWKISTTWFLGVSPYKSVIYPKKHFLEHDVH
jgi:hypothetical protein